MDHSDVEGRNWGGGDDHSRITKLSLAGGNMYVPQHPGRAPPTRILINSVLYEYGPGEVSEVCMVWEISQFAIL